MDIIDQIFTLFNEKGQGLYFGEQVTETEHALQAAYFAQKSGAPDKLVVAALLHDVGHLLHGMDEDIADHGVDAKHEDQGAEWLKPYFGPEILDCVRLHVDAKRYLTATEPAYLADLSEASKQSLKLQGGPFNSDEVAEFQKEPFFKEALQVRRWDDQAKVVDLKVPAPEHYRNLLEAALLKS